VSTAIRVFRTELQVRDGKGGLDHQGGQLRGQRCEARLAQSCEHQGCSCPSSDMEIRGHLYRAVMMEPWIWMKLTRQGTGGYPGKVKIKSETAYGETDQSIEQDLIEETAEMGFPCHLPFFRLACFPHQAMCYGHTLSQTYYFLGSVVPGRQ